MPKLGVKPDTTLRPYLFHNKTEQGFIMWEDLRLVYIHLFEGVLKQDINQVSLV